MSELQIIRDEAVNHELLKNKIVAILGYGNQGRAQAQCLRDSGIQTIVGGRPGNSWDTAIRDGFKVVTISEAVKQADILHILLPDEHQGEIFHNEIAPYLRAGQYLSFSHGFSITFKQIIPPPDVNVIMIAPKGPGVNVRKKFLEGFGLPGLIAVSAGGENARQVALAFAGALGLTKAGVFECTMAQEACGDLFGEQSVLCGGLVELMTNAFEVLTEAGYPPEIAYFECIHEVKLIADLVYERGMYKMNEAISNTAEWGEYVTGPRLITPQLKSEMKKVLREIENGTFAQTWIAEAASGAPNLHAFREKMASKLANLTGNKIRKITSGLK